MNPAGNTDNLIDGLPIERFEDLASEQIAGIIYDRWVCIMNNLSKPEDFPINDKN